MAKLVTIYALSDPRLDRVWENVRYVGKTVKRLGDRLSSHIAKKSTAHKCQWIRSLEAFGLRPSIWPLSFTSVETWEDEEKHWIKKLRAVANLTNVRDGGGTDVVWTDELRTAAKLRKFTPRTPEQNAAHAAKLRGRKQDQDRIDQRASKLIGKKRSPETRAKMRELQSNRAWSTWKAGAHHSEESKRNISEAKKGAPMHPKTRAALTKAVSIPVICLTTGEVFESATVAARHVGVDPATMARAAKHGYPCRGMKWEKVDKPLCHAQP